MLSKKNNLSVHKAADNARQMHHDFSALMEILAFEDCDPFDTRITLVKYLQKKVFSKSAKTKAKYYYEIITMFHAATAILHNGRYHYKPLMEDVDLEEIKEYLKKHAMVLLKDKPYIHSWAWQVREAALKSLDLDDMI